MTTSGARRRGLALAGAASCVSGVAVFVNGYGVGRFSDATVYTTAKNLVAAVVLLSALAVAAPSRSRGRDDDRSRRRVGWLGPVVLGAIGGSVPFVLFFEGLARADSVQAAFLHKTLVVWVALLAVPLLKERIGPLHVAAVGLLVWGQIVLVGNLDDLRVGTGEAMVLAATLLWAAEFVVAKRLLASRPPLGLGAARLAFGVVLLVADLAVTGRAGELVRLDVGQWTWAAATGVLLGVFVWAWYAGLALLPAVDAAAVLVFGAVVTAVLGGAFRGIALQPQVPGLALIGIGVLVVTAAAARPRPVALT